MPVKCPNTLFWAVSTCRRRAKCFEFSGTTYDALADARLCIKSVQRGGRFSCSQMETQQSATPYVEGIVKEDYHSL